MARLKENYQPLKVMTKAQLHIPDEACNGPMGFADLSKEPEFEWTDGELLDRLIGGPFFEEQRFLSVGDWMEKNNIPMYVENGDKISINPDYSNAPFRQTFLRSRKTGNVWVILEKL